MLRTTLFAAFRFAKLDARVGSNGACLSRVRLHTHLAENQSDVTHSLEKFGMVPGDYAESVGWLGADVWHAHCVQLSDESILKFGKTGTGVAHCPVVICALPVALPQCEKC